MTRQEEHDLEQDPNHEPEQLQAVSDKLISLEAGSAEARASAILSGLQFTPQMFNLTTKGMILFIVHNKMFTLKDCFRSYTDMY